MTFGKIIKTMNSAELFGCKRDAIGVAILKAAGIYIPEGQDIETTVSKWIDRSVPKNIINYFPDGKVNETEVIRYIKLWTAGNKWKMLQTGFTCLNMQFSEKELIYASDSETFYQSLLNQFIKSLGLPLTEELENDTLPDKVPTTLIATQDEDLSKLMRDIFIKTMDDFKIMDIINRKPAIMNREDSATLIICMNDINDLIVNHYREKCGNTTLYLKIKTFSHSVHMQALTIDKGLNSRFKFNDKSASINMESDDDFAKSDTKLNHSGIPKLSDEMIDALVDDAAADDGFDDAIQYYLDLKDLANEEWGNFRIKMNILYKKICALP